MRTWEEVKKWLEDMWCYIPIIDESFLKFKYENNPIEFFPRYMLHYFPEYCGIYNANYMEDLELWNKWIKEKTSDNNLSEYDVYYKHTKRYLCAVNAHSVKAELIKKEVQKLYPDVELLFYEPDKTRENWLKFYTYDKEIGLRKI